MKKSNLFAAPQHPINSPCSRWESHAVAATEWHDMPVTKRKRRSFDKSRRNRRLVSCVALKGLPLPEVPEYEGMHKPAPAGWIERTNDAAALERWRASAHDHAPQIALDLAPALEDIGSHFHKHTPEEREREATQSAWSGYRYDRSDLETAKRKLGRCRADFMMHLRHGGDVPASAERFMEAHRELRTIASRLKA
jgi:hypothetical protein